MKHDIHETESNLTQGGRRAGDEWKSGADPDEMRKIMEAAGTPGPAHRALDALVGNWKAEVKCWMEPGGPPSTSQAAAKASWIMNDHFVQEEFHGNMMGKPFHGRSLLGFDNTKQKFNSVWISDMQTSMFTCEGRGEAGNKVITLEGKSNCAMTGRKNVPMRTVLRVLSPDKHTFEMYDLGRGENAKTMEIVYTRA